MINKTPKIETKIAVSLNFQLEINLLILVIKELLCSGLVELESVDLFSSTVGDEVLFVSNGVEGLSLIVIKNMPVKFCYIDQSKLV